MTDRWLPPYQLGIMLPGDTEPIRHATDLETLARAYECLQQGKRLELMASSSGLAVERVGNAPLLGHAVSGHVNDPASPIMPRNLYQRWPSGDRPPVPQWLHEVFAAVGELTGHALICMSYRCSPDPRAEFLLRPTVEGDSYWIELHGSLVLVRRLEAPVPVRAADADSIGAAMVEALRKAGLP